MLHIALKQFCKMAGSHTMCLYLTYMIFIKLILPEYTNFTRRVKVVLNYEVC